MSGLPEFIVVSISLIAVFISSGVPIPLYNMYRFENGVTNSNLALTTVAYLGTTAVALVSLGRLSNHLGRKPVAIAAVLIGSAACLVMTQINGALLLTVGRMLQGLACALASTAIGSYVIDTAGHRVPRWLPAVITSSAPPFSNPIGALFSGMMVQMGLRPRVSAYLCLAVILALLAVLLAFCAETTGRKVGVIASLIPKVHVPKGQGKRLFSIGAVIVSAWSLSGFYQAFSPTLTADHLGTNNALVVAVVFSSIVVLSPIGGSLTGKLRPVLAIRIGLTGFVLAACAVTVSLFAQAIVPFLIFSFIAGILQGASNSGALRDLLATADPSERPGVLATIYLISYGGAAAPSLVAGRVATQYSLNTILLGYMVIVVVCAIIALTTLRERSTAHFNES
ncbi:MFS transporter [Bifidobacterium psychraerophilum]|uniref:MFS transporter n=1 Tax=Bifidobacterium psychraerophilum TaxID=218140 RepID=UPI0039E76353